MNSLNELNALSATSVTVTDLRPSRVIFDFDQFDDQEINITSTVNAITPSRSVVDIWNYTTANVRYIVTIYPGTINPLVGSTVTWASIPSGLTLTQVGNVYTITGFTKASDWTAVKNFTWTLPANYNTKPLFYLKVSVTWYDSELAQDVERDWFIYDNDYFYNAELDSLFSVSATGLRIKSSSCAISAAWTLTLNPATFKPGVANLNSSFSVTASGINNGVIIESNSSLTAAVSYVSRNNPAALASQASMFTLNTTYLDAVRASETYTLNTTTAISNGPLITDALQDGSGTYYMTVVPNPTGAVSSMSSTGRLGYNNAQLINNPNPKYTNEFFPSSVAFSANDQYMAVGHENYLANVSPPAGSGLVYVYSRGVSTWSGQASVAPTSLYYNSASGYFGSEVALSSDGTTLAVGARYEHASNNPLSGSADYECGAVYIFTRSGSTWTQQAKLVASSRRNSEHIAAAGRLVISDDGNTVLAASQKNSAVNRIYMWTRSGSTWTEQSYIADPDSQTDSLFANKIALNAAGDTLAAEAPFYNSSQGAVYIFTRSGSSWTQQQRIIPSGAGSNSQTGNISLSTLGETVAFTSIISSTKKTFVYTRSGGTWTEAQSITSTNNPILAATDTYLFLGSNLYKKSGSTWSLSTTLSTAYDKISPSSTYLIDIDHNATVSGVTGAGALTSYVSAVVGSSWNAITKTLTLSGTRSQVNSDLDTIQMIPTTGYNQNFVLTYTVTTPRVRTDSRDQQVNYS